MPEYLKHVRFLHDLDLGRAHYPPMDKERARRLLQNRVEAQFRARAKREGWDGN